MRFCDWIRGQISANGVVGEFSRFTFGIKLPDADRKAIRNQLKTKHACDARMLKAFDVSYRAYREQI